MTSLNEGKGRQHHNDIRQNKLEGSEVIEVLEPSDITGDIIGVA